jgi:hypothetical protein
MDISQEKDFPQRVGMIQLKLGAISAGAIDIIHKRSNMSSLPICMGYIQPWNCFSRSGRTLVGKLCILSLKFCGNTFNLGSIQPAHFSGPPQPHETIPLKSQYNNSRQNNLRDQTSKKQSKQLNNDKQIQNLKALVVRSTC